MATHLDTSNIALARRYDDIPYDALPHEATHPRRLGMIAALAGHASARPGRCRVLEVGCSDGANLIAMAVSLPGARFVGCDLSSRAIEAGRRVVAALGLVNVTLLQGDLAALPADSGSFDYIVAHGVYSWVPASVRDALLALASARLAPNGVLYVSYNVLPGCRVRQAVWDTLHPVVDHIDDARQRLAAARQIARLVAEGGAPAVEADAAVRAEFAAIAGKSDSELCHDDLAVPNEPVLFQTFVAHAAEHGLQVVGDADPTTTSTDALSAEARTSLAALEPLAREQAMDFLRLRRFRQSLCVRQVDAIDAARRGPSWSDFHVSAGAVLLRRVEAGEGIHKIARMLDPAGGGGGPLRQLLERLVDVRPAAVAVGDLAGFAPRPGADRANQPLETMLRQACQQGIVDLHLEPPPVAARVAERPVASPLARRQAAAGERLASLLHTAVVLADANALKLLPLVDGSRDRAALVDGVRQLGLPIEPSQAPGFVDYALQKFARLGLLLSASDPAPGPT